MGDIPAKKFAGVLMILIPIIFWLTMYLRYDCAGGTCVLRYEWLIVGFFVTIFGLVLLVSSSGDTTEELQKRVEELEDELQEYKDREQEQTTSKNARKKKAV